MTVPRYPGTRCLVISWWPGCLQPGSQVLAFPPPRKLLAGRGQSAATQTERRVKARRRPKLQRNSRFPRPLFPSGRGARSHLLRTCRWPNCPRFLLTQPIWCRGGHKHILSGRPHCTEVHDAAVQQSLTMPQQLGFHGPSEPGGTCQEAV